MKNLAEEIIFETLTEMVERSLILGFDLGQQDPQTYDLCIATSDYPVAEISLQIPVESDAVDVANLLLRAMENSELLVFSDVIGINGGIAYSLSILYKTASMDNPLELCVVPYHAMI